MNAYEACQLAQSIYNPIVQTAFDQTWNVQKINFGYKQVGTLAVFSFAGTENLNDALRDIDVVPMNHPLLGRVHSGFMEGMEEVFTILRPFLKGDILITGHSLGGAHGIIFAGLCAAHKIPVKQLILFAPPRAGFRKLHDLIHINTEEINAFRNGIDLVSEVPEILGWIPVDILLPLDEPPLLGILDPLGYHAVALYLAGTKKYCND